MKVTSKLIALALLACAAISAQAGTQQVSKNPIITEPTATESGWWFQSTMNTWLAGIEGDIGARGLNAAVDSSIGDVLEDLDFAYMTHLEFGYKRWGIGLDGVYAKLSSDASFDYGPVSGDASVEIEQAFVTGRVQYRAIESDAFTLDLFGGVRWTYLDTDTDIRASFSFNHPALQRFNGDANRRFDFSEDWIDPIVGFRSIIGLNDVWFLQIAGDVGGFGVASDLTWQALGAVGYRFTPRIAALVGYRALGVDYEDNGFKIDTVNHGPAFALNFKF